MHSEKGMQRQKISEEKMAKYLTSVGIDYRVSTTIIVATEIQEDKWSMLDFLMIGVIMWKMIAAQIVHDRMRSETH
jgi:hypothetical protein